MSALDTNVAIRRVFETSRELMVERAPDREGPQEHRDGIAYTCDLCGHGGLVTARDDVYDDDRCGCIMTWASCPAEECEQAGWGFVDYSDCRIHGRTKPNDLWATLTPGVDFDA